MFLCCYGKCYICWYNIIYFNNDNKNFWVGLFWNYVYSFIEFHTDIKYLLNRFICYTEMISFNSFFKALIFKYNMISNLTKYAFSVFRITPRKSIYKIQAFVGGQQNVLKFPSYLGIKFLLFPPPVQTIRNSLVILWI